MMDMQEYTRVHNGKKMEVEQASNFLGSMDKCVHQVWTNVFIITFATHTDKRRVKEG